MQHEIAPVDTYNNALAVALALNVNATTIKTDSHFFIVFIRLPSFFFIQHIQSR